MKVVIFIFFIIGVWSIWNNPVSLYSDKNKFFVKDIYTDPSDGTHHILYTIPFSEAINCLHVDSKGKEIRTKTLMLEKKNEISKARIIGLGNGDNFYILIMAFRPCEDYSCYDQYFTETDDGGETWSPIIRVPRDNMNDTCHRYGDSILVESNRIFIFYHVDCPPELAQIYYVERKNGSNSFEKERSIYKSKEYNQVRPSITAEFSVADKKKIIHLFWGNFAEKWPVMAMHSEDNGNTWSEAIQINGSDFYAGFLMLSSTSNRKITSTVIGAYAASPASTLRLFYTKDNSKTFDIIKGTENNQIFTTWDYRPISLAICGSKTSPMLFLLSEISESVYVYSDWDINTMKKISEKRRPFEKVVKGQGNWVTCFQYGDKLIAGAFVSHVGEDGKYYITLVQNILPMPS